jgi:hypothetical protein
MLLTSDGIISTENKAMKVRNCVQATVCTILYLSVFNGHASNLVKINSDLNDLAIYLYSSTYTYFVGADCHRHTQCDCL